MQMLLDAWPTPIERLAIVGHSMGGLVARSACHYATQAGHTLPGRLDDLVLLGTPHIGAPPERAGAWVDFLMEISPYSAPLARLGKVRSALIKDLRHGYVRDEDWQPHSSANARDLSSVTDSHFNRASPSVGEPIGRVQRRFAVASGCSARTDLLSRA